VIPAILKSHKNWLIWHTEFRLDGAGKMRPTKVPYQGKNPEKRAASDDPETWTDFKTVSMIIHRNRTGIGYCFDGSGIYGIDLDGAINPDGTVYEPFKPIIEGIQSYQEKSPSTIGLHIIFQCDEDPYPSGKSKQWMTENGAKREVGLFGKGKYFTVTDNQYGECNTVEKIPVSVIRELLNPFFTEEKKETVTSQESTSKTVLSDDEIISLCHHAKNGNKFFDLFDKGSTTGYASASEADMALAAIIGFYTRDTSQITRIMERSHLAREKYQREGYLDKTASKAVSSPRETYTAPRKTKQGDELPVPSKWAARDKGETRDKVADKKKEDIPIPRAWLVDDKGIYLTVLDKHNKKWFAYLEGEDIKFSETLPANSRIVPRSLPWKDGAPIPIVGIPSREAIETAKDLSITEIETLINVHLYKYCDLRIIDKELCLYYIFFTWFYPKIGTVPYLRLRADTGKGKTRIQKTVGDLCFYPITAEGASSPSGVMRFAEKWHGTLVMDEMDIKSSPKESESGGYQLDLIKYLNLGFERGKYYIKSDKSDLKKQEIFDPFCPKVISMRGIFQDVATEGRILSISTYETTRPDIPPTLHSDYYESVIVLRGIIARYVLKHWSFVDGTKYPDLTFLKVESRLKQLTEPIGVIISQIFPTGLGKIKEYINARQNEIRKDRSESWEGSCFNLAYSLAIDEECPGYVTPQSIAQVLGTKATTVTRTLKNIGFDTHENKRDVPVYENSMGTKRQVSTKKKTVRYLVIPNENVGNQQQILLCGTETGRGTNNLSNRSK
jgi:primase-polymerase (primpol)-like protein